MNRPNPKVDGYVRKSTQWQEELQTLRAIVLDCQLTEEVKWRVPCYTFEGHNIVIIARFKQCCVLTLFKGALLNDAHGILVKPGENTQSARVIRFTNVSQILEIEPILKAYIRESIRVEQAGLKVHFKTPSEFTIPLEFQNKLNSMPALKTAFNALTPGRQRAYILYFSAPKQSKTRESRVEKCTQRILEGQALNDKPQHK